MTDELQEALRGTLKAASRDVPAPEPDLLDQLARRHRARRRNRAVATATATVTAVLVVLGGTMFVLHSGQEASPGPLTSRSAIPMPTAALPKSVPVPKSAVRTVPDTLPNGRRYLPQVALDQRSLLVSTESRFEVTDRLWVYDLQTHKATKVTDVVVPAGSKIFASDFAVGDGQVVWWLRYVRQGRSLIEIWGAPLAGGKAHKISSIDAGSNKASGLDKLVVGDGKIYSARVGFSKDLDAVYEEPLTGGPARRIPGTAGYRILAWPWIGTPGGSRGKAGEATFRNLRDVETGQTRGVNLPKIQNGWICGITWCVGSPATGIIYNGGGPDSHVLRRDGKVGRTLSDDIFFGMGAPMYDRFISYTVRGKRVYIAMLYDLQTGKLLELGTGKHGSVWGTISSADQGGPGPFLDRYLIRRTTGSIQVVDLAAID
jgi:hypothetical protein